MHNIQLHDSWQQSDITSVMSVIILDRLNDNCYDICVCTLNRAHS